MRRIALLVLAICAVSSCGTSDVGTGAPIADVAVSAPATTPRPSIDVEPSVDRAADVSAVIAIAAAERVRSEPISAGLGVNVVERFGLSQADGLIVPDATGELLSEQTRAAVEDALSPVTVTWVASVDEVVGDGSASADEIGVVLTLTAPTIRGNVAEVGSALWCGMVCGAGGTYTLERTTETDWTVTGVFDEFVA